MGHTCAGITTLASKPTLRCKQSSRGHYAPVFYLKEIKKDLPDWSDEQIQSQIIDKCYDQILLHQMKIHSIMMYNIKQHWTNGYNTQYNTTLSTMYITNIKTMYKQEYYKHFIIFYYPRIICMQSRYLRSFIF
jgi:hypothetical protein